MATEPRTVRQRAASERGAVLIQVGVAILVLSAFAMFIIDYGALWVSRHQAQNAADSGALAGAIALAFDDFDDRSDTGPAKMAAQSFAKVNSVFGESPDVDMTTDVRFYNDAPAAFPPSCVTDDCIRVDVYRNQDRDNPLPTFFGHIVGVNNQGVRAMAIARAAVANASRCIKPWAVPDKWQENTGTPDSFDPVGATPDVYIPQNGDNSSGTGYSLNDIGTELILKPDINTADPFGTPGWFQELSLPAAPGPKSAYEQNILGCTTATYAVGETVSIENLPGNRSGPTIHGTEDLILTDPYAEWDPDAKKVVNSCVEPPYSCSQPGYKQSPRIVTIPVFNTQHFYDTGGPGRGEILIQQFLGFFVDRVQPSANGQGQQEVVGILAQTVGLSVSNGGSVAASSAFLHTVQLVR
jgi:Flp pilus assembly protein TadG